MEWEWDDAKNTANTEKHGISFEEALQVFTDPEGIEKEDLQHSSIAERRLWRTGKLKSGRIVTVVYTLLGDSIGLSPRKKDAVKGMSMIKQKKKKGTSSRFRQIPHPRIYREEEIGLSNAKVNIHIRLDAEVVNYFKEKAQQEGEQIRDAHQSAPA